MVVKQMQQRRRREDWAGATSGWEERAPPDPRRWRTPAVRTSWRDGCTAAAIAKVPDIICMARRAKLTIYLKPKEIHDKCSGNANIEIQKGSTIRDTVRETPLEDILVTQ
uniref:Uncharacterized protein n=1 Tax=Oryza nivara TaxID=4536 RepID=A0A0E0IS76_ORYNI